MEGHPGGKRKEEKEIRKLEGMADEMEGRRESEWRRREGERKAGFL